MANFEGSFINEELSYQERLYERVNEEYSTFISEIKRESADVLIQSAAEIVDKDRIRLYLEEYTPELTDEQYEALLSREYPLDEIYEQWTKNGELHGLEDVGIALEETADRIMISLEREQPSTPVVESVLINAVEYSYINWNEFDEVSYNALVDDVKNHNSYGSDYAFSFAEKKYSDLRLELNIRELGEQWALDYDVYDYNTEDYIHLGGYYENEIPTYKEFISNVEAEAKKQLEGATKQRFVFMVEQNGEKSFLRNDKMTVERLKKECISAEKPYLYCIENGRGISEVEFAEISQSDNGLAVEVNVDNQEMRVYNNDIAETYSFDEIRKDNRLAEITEQLDLEHNNFAFSVVTLNGKNEFVIGGYADGGKVIQTDEYINFAKDNKNNITVKVEFYSVGNREFIKNDITEEQAKYVQQHLDDVLEISNIHYIDSYDILPVIDEKQLARRKVEDYVTDVMKKELDGFILYSSDKIKEIDYWANILKSDISDEEKINASKHFVPEKGELSFDVFNNIPVSDELKIIGISPSDICPNFETYSDGVRLVWDNIFVDFSWKEYVEACVWVASAIESPNKTNEFETDLLSLYSKSYDEAKEIGETEQYFADLNESKKCAVAIQNAISDNYSDNRLNADGVLSDVLKDYTFERVELIVAANISALNYDGRISSDNKAWANKIMSNFSEKEYNKITECCYVNAHAGLIDMLAKAVQNEADRAIEKEQSATAENKNSTYEIYQIPSGEQYHDLRFLRYEQLEKFGQQIDPNNYEKVYSGSLDDVPYENKLEGIYDGFNINLPKDFEGRSLSVSDIVVINDENGSHAHYVDSFGYKDVSDSFLIENGKEKTEAAVFKNSPVGNSDNEKSSENSCEALLLRLEEIREWASSVTEALDSLEKDIQEIKTR